MPPITSQEALMRPTPMEAYRQKSELITRAEQAHYNIGRTKIIPPVPNETSQHYYLLMERANSSEATTQLGIVEEDFVNGESHQIPLMQFHRSTEIVGTNTRSLREIRVPVMRSGEVDWVTIEPGTHIYDDAEDTISYVEKYLAKAENSVMDRIAAKIASTIYGYPKPS